MYVNLFIHVSVFNLLHFKYLYCIRLIKIYKIRKLSLQKACEIAIDRYDMFFYLSVIIAIDTVSDLIKGN